MSEDIKKDREPYSVTRLNKEIVALSEGIEKNVWPHVKAIASLTGYDISEDCHSVPLSGDDLPAMVKAFELVSNVKEALNQLHISLINLAHDLNPEWYNPDNPDNAKSEA